MKELFSGLVKPKQKKCQKSTSAHKLKKQDMILSQNCSVPVISSGQPRNLNTIVFATPGTCVKRNFLYPNLLQMNGSFITVDYKKEDYSFTREILEKNGYKVELLDLSLSDKSESYNPLYYCKTVADVENLVSCFPLLYDGYNSYYKDVYLCLFSALISFLTVNAPQKDVPYAQMPEIVGDRFYFKNPTLKDFFNLAEMACSRSINEYFSLLHMFCRIRRYESEVEESSYCFQNWEQYYDQPDVVKDSIHSILMDKNGLVIQFKESGLDKITQKNTIQIEKLGVEKTAVFVNIGPYKQKDINYLVRMYFNQVYSQLMSFKTLLVGSKKMVLPNGELVKWFSADDIDSCQSLECDIKNNNIVAVADGDTFKILGGGGKEIARVATYSKAEQYIRALKRYRIKDCIGSFLPMHVSIVLSEQEIIGEIPLTTISMAIARNISTTIVTTSIGSFVHENRHPDALLANSCQWIYMGCTDKDTYAFINKEIEKMYGLPLHKKSGKEKQWYCEYDMPVEEEIVILFPERRIIKDKKYKLENHPNYKHL